MRWQDSFFIKIFPFFLGYMLIWYISKTIVEMVLFDWQTRIPFEVLSAFSRVFFPIALAIPIMGVVIDLMRFFEHRNEHTINKSGLIGKIVLVILLLLLGGLLYTYTNHIFIRIPFIKY